MSDELYGTWSLIAAAVETGNGDRHDLYGPNPRGRLIVDRSGHMIVLLTSGDSPVTATGAPLLMAYTGRVTLHADRFVTDVDSATIPSWEGTAQTRKYTIAGDRLSIVSAAGPHPAFPGGDVVGILEWRREG